MAASHNDALLCLDELAEVDPRDAGETAYMLANGQGKLRQTKAITLRRPLEWRILFLSSGEISLAEHMSTANKRIRGGMEVRLIHLPAEASQGFGLFEHLHEFKSGKEFSEHLQEASKTYYGTAARAFIKSIIQQPLETLRTDWRDFKLSFFKTYCPSDVKEEVGRACDRFALVAFAGELATKVGITGWEEGEATAGIAQFFKEWLAMRGTGRTDEEAAIQQVRLFIEQHGDSRFRRLNNNDDRTLSNQAGLVENFQDGAVYYFKPAIFQAEVCKGYEAKQVAKALQSRQWLICGHGLQHKLHDPDNNRTLPFYAVSSAILDTE